MKERVNDGFKKNVWKPILIGIGTWVILNISGVQQAFFKQGDILTIIIIKILHLLLLCLVAVGVYFLFLNAKKDIRYKDMIKISILYFFVLIVILILIWPGAWAWDDLLIIKNAQYFNFTPWQHFLSGLFHILSAQTIPIASGVIIMQIFFASLIVGYIVSFLGHAISNKHKKSFRMVAIFLVMPFFLLPVVYYVMTGYRMGIYQYLEILLLSMILIKYYTKEKITICWYLILIVLTVVVGAWRTEGIIVAMLVPVLLFFIRSDFLTKKKIMLTFLILIVGIGGIGKINNFMINNNNYSVGAIILPLVENIRKGNIDENSKIEIDKVLELECLYQYTELSAEHIFHKCLRDDYSSADYSSFMVESLKIIIGHPRTSFTVMLDMFAKTNLGLYDDNGLSTTWTTAIDAASVFEEGSLSGQKWGQVDSKLKYPINSNLRKDTINLIAGSMEEKSNFYQPIFWSLVIPMVLWSTAMVIAIVRKKWFFLIMELIIVSRVVVVFLTTMAPYFMYYMPFYISSVVLFVFIVMDECCSRRNYNMV